jgi:hypothetical protein
MKVDNQSIQQFFFYNLDSTIKKDGSSLLHLKQLQTVKE